MTANCWLTTHSGPLASQLSVAKSFQPPSPSSCRKAVTPYVYHAGVFDSNVAKRARRLRGFDEPSGLIVCQGSADDPEIMLGGNPDEHIPAHIVLANGR
jgi:hypothetical protein